MTAVIAESSGTSHRGRAPSTVLSVLAPAIALALTIFDLTRPTRTWAAAHQRPFTWSWPALQAHVPAGLPAALALLVLVLAAHSVHALGSRYRLLGGVLGLLVTGLAVLASVLTAILLPEHLRAASVQDWTRRLLILALVMLCGKFLLLHRFARRAYVHQDEQNETGYMLPSRQADRDSLLNRVDEDRPGRVIPIQGRWGEGKSFLLNAMTSRWTGARGGVVFIIVDVWQLENDVDLQVNIIDQLFSKAAYLRGFRWLRIPLTFTLAGPIWWLRRAVETVRLKVSGGRADIEAEIRMPRVDWQHTFERITSGCDAQRTVIALDEIDRASPSATQAALTLARRSADSHKVSVILPYTRELIRYKAFNPLLPQMLPDLASSMDAVIYHHVAGRGEIGQERASDLEKSLRRDFAGLDPANRERLQELFEEKYLGPAGVTLGFPTAEDLIGLMTMVKSVRREVAEVAGSYWTDHSPAREETIVAIRQGFTQARGERDAPPIRVLESILIQVFRTTSVLMTTGQAPGTRQHSSSLRPRTAAVMALAALDIAARRYGLDPAGPSA